MLRLLRAAALSLACTPCSISPRTHCMLPVAIPTSLPHAASLSQFVRLGPLPARDPSEAYCPDHRLRLGVGLKAAAIGGRTLAAGAWQELAWAGRGAAGGGMTCFVVFWMFS